MTDEPIDPPPPSTPPPPSPDAARDAKARAVGQARFGTPIEADNPVNPDPDSAQPFTEVPDAEGRSRPA